MDTILDQSAWPLSDDGQARFVLRNITCFQLLEDWNVANPGHLIKVKIYEEKRYLMARVEGDNATHIKQVNSIIEEYYYPYLIREGDASPLS